MWRTSPRYLPAEAWWTREKEKQGGEITHEFLDTGRR